jgi:hypothetical protein
MSCSFNSTDCKGEIKTMTNNTKIPITQKETILVGMKLCQTHYNKFIIKTFWKSGVIELNIRRFGKF